MRKFAVVIAVAAFTASCSRTAKVEAVADPSEAPTVAVAKVTTEDLLGAGCRMMPHLASEVLREHFLVEAVPIALEPFIWVMLSFQPQKLTEAGITS